MAWLLLAPAIAAFAVSPPAAGAFLAERRAGEVTSPGPDSYGNLPDDGQVELDVREYVWRVQDRDPQLPGRTATLTGFVSRSDSPGSWYLTRMAYHLLCRRRASLPNPHLRDASAGDRLLGGGHWHLSGGGLAGAAGRGAPRGAGSAADREAGPPVPVNKPRQRARQRPATRTTRPAAPQTAHQRQQARSRQRREHLHGQPVASGREWTQPVAVLALVVAFVGVWLFPKRPDPTTSDPGLPVIAAVPESAASGQAQSLCQAYKTWVSAQAAYIDGGDAYAQAAVDAGLAVMRLFNRYTLTDTDRAGLAFLLAPYVGPSELIDPDLAVNNRNASSFVA